MPFKNEHAARIKNPELYEEFARDNDKFGNGIDAIYGIRVRDGKRVSELQAIRFDKKKFTVAQAKKWLSDHDHKPLEFVPASDEEKQTAKFRSFTYNSVKVQATSRRSSDRDDKAWMRIVRQGDTERVVHYADPDMPMRRNNPEARKNFLARHNCDEKKDPFAPGFWACYDWANPSEKEIEPSDKGMEGKNMSETNDEKMYAGEMPQVVVTSPLGGATSFAELDAMVEADEVAEQIGTMAYQFREIVSNIMASDVEDKAGAVAALANEFSNRMGQATKETETHDKELLRYKEIESNDDLAIESDFVGGCQICGFGEPELVKELSACPFCHNEPGGDANV